MTTLADLYPWLKALHVAAALGFVGGVVAETAFLAVHRQSEAFAPAQVRAAAAFHALDRRFTTPAMLVVWGAGLALAIPGGWFWSGWLQAKLVFVLALSALHGVQSGAMRRLAGRAIAPRTQRGPALTILVSVVAIALLAVTKPF